MPGLILKTGDLAKLTPLGPHIAPLLVAPMPLKGSSSTAGISGLPICLQGDEIPPPWMVPLPYTSPPYVVPGVGTLSFDLPTNFYTKTSLWDNKPALILGTPFPVKFQVSVPAIMPAPPAPPAPDPQTSKQYLLEYLPIVTPYTIMAS